MGLLALSGFPMICYHQFMADDSSQPATKADVRAVREELKAVEQRLDQKIDRVAMEVVKTQAQIEDISSKMATKDDFCRLMNTMDDIAGTVKHYQRADITRGKTLIDVEIQMKDHEKRITTLESARR